MSKIIRTRKPSVLPFYAMALVFLVLCAVLPVYKLWALLAALGGAFVAFGAAQKVCPPRVVEHEVPFHTGVEDVDAMLTDIQQKLDTLHTLNEQLPDPQLSAAMTRMEKAGRSIVEAVEANPEKAKQVRRFANYYLPDAVNVLQPSVPRWSTMLLPLPRRLKTSWMPCTPPRAWTFLQISRCCRTCSKGRA